MTAPVPSSSSSSSSFSPLSSFPFLPTPTYITRPPWQSQAACRFTSPSTFFPDNHLHTFAAKQICAHCPVTKQCLDSALLHREQFGVWGGMTLRERQEYLRQHPEIKLPPRPKPTEVVKSVVADMPRVAISWGKQAILYAVVDAVEAADVVDEADVG